MHGVKGEDLVKICSMYENYRFRTPQRLLQTSSLNYQEESATHVLRRKTRRQKHVCKNYTPLDDHEATVAPHRKHPAGHLQIKCGEGLESSVVAKLRRCRIGDRHQTYKHGNPHVMVTSNKLPSIFKQVGFPEKESWTKYPVTGKLITKPLQHVDVPQTALDETQGGKGARENHDAEGGNNDDDNEWPADGESGEEKKVVSFGGARIVGDMRIRQGWRAHHPIQSIHLKYPSKIQQQATGDEVWNHRVLLPGRGRLHVRFPGKRGKPPNPTTARLKSDNGRSIKPSHSVVPPSGVSILKPAKSAMVIPTPCFPCSPEFERTFRSLRGQPK